MWRTPLNAFKNNRLTPENHMSSPYIAQITTFAFNWAPVNWSLCNGALLPLMQNQALFALIGTTFGGNGSTTFGLPNLQGRFPLGQGNGAGLTPRTIGQMSGTESLTLSPANLPAHAHAQQISATTNLAGSATPSAGAYLGKCNDPGTGSEPNTYFSGANPALVTLAAGNTANTGSNAPFNHMNPFLVLNFCIAVQGLFPSRP